MKNLLSLIQSAVTRMGAAALLLAPLSAAHATNITQWTFENDAIAVNNGPAPSTGTGTASSIGMNVYPTPNIGITQDDVVQGASGDTGANGVANLTKIWRVRGQAGSSGAANGWSSAAPIGTQGGVFATSTAGFGSITVSFDWYTTTAGEGKLQLQYTTDGSTWNNVAMTLGGTTSGISVKTNTTSSKTVMGSYVQASAQDWFQGLTATISDPAAANNANFAIRMVNASTGTDCVNAAGAALNNTSGNWRFDNVLISGTTFTPTVTYVGNGSTGGTVPVDGNSPYASGATVTVLDNSGSLVKTGNTFSGWNTAANGAGTSYAAGAQFTISANTTLYAQWTPVTYTVTYNGNGNMGGTAPVDGSSPYASGATVTVLGNTGALTKTGSSFSSWNTSADGTGTAYAPAAC